MRDYFIEWIDFQSFMFGKQGIICKGNRLVVYNFILAFNCWRKILISQDWLIKVKDLKVWLCLFHFNSVFKIKTVGLWVNGLKDKMYRVEAQGLTHIFEYSNHEKVQHLWRGYLYTGCFIFHGKFLSMICVLFSSK